MTKRAEPPATLPTYEVDCCVGAERQPVARSIFLCTSMGIDGARMPDHCARAAPHGRRFMIGAIA